MQALKAWSSDLHGGNVIGLAVYDEMFILNQKQRQHPFQIHKNTVDTLINGSFIPFNERSEIKNSSFQCNQILMALQNLYCEF